MPIWSPAWRHKSGSTGPNFNINLPTELWAMIIDLFLVGVRHSYLSCEPKTFPQYKELLWNVDTSDKIPILEDWKRVRTVCKEWKQRAGVKPFFFLKGTWPNFSGLDIPISTSILSIHCMEDPRLSMGRIAHLRENLTTLALGFTTSAGTVATDILLENPSMFPNLRCLSVGSTRTKRSFWKVIQDEFPNLVSLTVRLNVYGEPGRYVLKKLEILSLLSLDGLQLVCPSLKHLHFGSTTSASVREFIVGHGHQLESFIGSIWPFLIRKEPVWSSIFLNLVMAGCSMRLGPRAVPPPDHPLRHLRLTAGHNGWKPEEVMAEIDAYAFPEIESVHINMNEMKYGTANELRSQCRKRGIRLVKIVDGKPAVIPPPRPMKNYIKTAFRLCTLPCRWPCLEFDARYHD
ncbi:hypothetical protein FRC18_009777 [Serendipita sp. 400]|nr:hypothetical protein FRC18_009777 [Serendipita sp. 400]